MNKALSIMYYIFKISLIISIVLLLIHFLSSNIQAQANQMVRVSPIILKVNLSPGSLQTYNIQVENLLNEPLPIKASVEGFGADEEEGGFTTGQIEKSPLIEWLKINDADSILAPKEKKNFTLTLSVPSTVPVGGYYAVIFFTPFFPNVPVSSKIGVLALANIGVQSKNSGEILALDINPNKALIRVKNTSLNFFTAKPYLMLRPVLGAPKEIELEEKTLLPGKVRRWEKELKLESFLPFYFAELKVSLEKDNYIYSKKLFLYWPSPMFWVVLVLLLALIFRTRIIKAVRVFARG